MNLLELENISLKLSCYLIFLTIACWLRQIKLIRGGQTYQGDTSEMYGGMERTENERGSFWGKIDRWEEKKQISAEW